MHIILSMSFSLYFFVYVNIYIHKEKIVGIVGDFFYKLGESNKYTLM